MNLDFRNTNSLWCSVLAETLYRCGVRHAIVSPGSRSTPLVFALAAHLKIETTPILDERSAAFFALGIAKQSTPARPVALVCTSGTAAANFFPAIIEAQESNVPLIVITADRPPEMRECGSGQTIDQQKLYGSHVNWYHELAVPEATLERLRYLRQTVAHACERAAFPECGPIHLNAPFRDPLPPVEDGIAKKLRGKIGEEFFKHLEQGGTDIPVCAEIFTTGRHRQECLCYPIPALSSAKRALIIAGPDAQSDEVTRIAAQTGWPVLADALSAARHAAAPKNIVRVSAYDAILRNARAARALAPDFVLCIGGWPTSKVLRAWLEKTQPEILMLAPTARNRDALHGRTRWRLLSGTGCQPVSGKHGQAAHATAQAHGLAVCATSYRAAWQRAKIAARVALDDALAKIADTDLFEPRAAWLLAQHLPERTPIFIANSMPVRDAEYFWPATTRAHRLYFNRGANGIDGTLSTALGVAHGSAQPAVLLTGDLSLLHDTNGFLQARSSKLRGSLTIVLINNNGGGIFEHLPVAQFDPPFEKFIATPQNIDFAKLCATYGVEHTRIESWSQFTKLISANTNAFHARGVRVLEIRTDRKHDTARRKTLLAQAADAANTTGA